MRASDANMALSDMFSVFATCVGMEATGGHTLHEGGLRPGGHNADTDGVVEPHP